MLSTFLVWGLLDAFLYIKYGNVATESATTWRDAYLSAGLTFSIGSLMGHFFAQRRAPSTQTVTPPTYKRVGEIVLLSIMGAWLAVDGLFTIFKGVPSPADTLVWSATGHRVWLVFLTGFAIGGVFLPMDEPTTPGGE
jgi:hypothetical protein